MKSIKLRAMALLLLLAASGHAAEEWTNLFDGKSLAGWRPYGSSNAIPDGWQVADGLLRKVPGKKGGDIVSVRKFADFELEWEWRIAPGANNGVKYLVTEERRGAPGPEYQMIDDTSAKWSKQAAKNQTAALYDILPAAADKPLKPAGEWNVSRIVVQGAHVEHWLNGAKVLEFEVGGEAFKAGMQTSKFKRHADFGLNKPGHIMLTDHNDEAWYRSIRIRERPSP